MIRTTKPDLIILALPRWDNKYSSTPWSLAKEFAKDMRVFYVDNPFTVKEYLFGYLKPDIANRRKALLWGKDNYKVLKEVSENLIAVTPRLVLPINWLPEGQIYEYLLNVNNRIVDQCIRGIVRDFEVNRYILINSFNPGYQLKYLGYQKPMIQVYQTLDEIKESDYISRHGSKQEIDAIKKADLTLATSKELTRQKSKWSNHVHYLPNAADVQLFRSALEDPNLKCPPELQEEERDVICYIGHIDKRLDYELLKQVIESHARRLFLFVGPFDEALLKSNQIWDLPNVRFTGQKKLEELPAYLKYSRCGIIPFKRNELTKNIYPLKVNEYLGAGLPVVSTDFSSDIRLFSQVIYLSRDHQEFMKNIELAIQEDSKELIQERLGAVENNTWESRAKLFLAILDKHSK